MLDAVHLQHLHEGFFGGHPHCIRLIGLGGTIQTELGPWKPFSARRPSRDIRSVACSFSIDEGCGRWRPSGGRELSAALPGEIGQFRKTAKGSCASRARQLACSPAAMVQISRANSFIPGWRFAPKPQDLGCQDRIAGTRAGLGRGCCGAEQAKATHTPSSAMQAQNDSAYPPTTSNKMLTATKR